MLAQLRRDLRTQWRSLLALAVLVGLIGGVVLASTMAARRTASAYTRYVGFAHAEDINIGAPGINDPTFAAAVSDIESFPEVVAVGPISSQELLSTEEGLEFFALGGVDDRVGTTINRPKILEGRDADPEAEAEVTVNRSMADALDLVPGDPLTLYGFDGGNSETREDRDVAVEDGRRQVFTVTGISLYPNEVVPTAPLDDAPRVYLTPAQVRAHPNEGEEFAFIAVRLRNGAADAPAFRAHFAELLADSGVPEDAVPVLEASERTATVQRSIRPQAQALGAFALLVGLTGFVVLGQAYARQLSADAADRRALWALGFSRRQLTATALLRVAVSVTLGAALAAAVGVALAPLALTGPARAADPDTGVAVDGVVIAVGFAAIIVLLLIRAAFAVRSGLPTAKAPSRTTVVVRRRARLVAGLARVGARPPATVGVQMALEPDDANRQTSTGALVGTVVAVAAVVAAFTFSVNLDRLVGTPELFGWNWDVQVGGGFDAIPTEEALERLGAVPSVRAYSGGATGELTFTSASGRSQEIPTIGLDRVEGDVYPRLLEGRAAAGPDEVVLGSTTMADLDVSVGEEVVVERADGETIGLEVVGRAVLPAIGAGNFATAGLGRGAVVTAEVLDTTGNYDDPDPVAAANAAAGLVTYTYFLVEYRPDVDPVTADGELLAALDPVMTECGQLCVQGPQQPGDIRNYDRVRSTPVALAAVLVVLAIAILVHTLVTTVRRWRSDLALLTTLGFIRRQSAAATAWHAFAVAGVSLLVGVPIGAAVGRVVWNAFARHLGVDATAVTPWVAIALVVPAALVLAVLVAVVPALMARGTRPAVALRAA
ncbi:MAG: FtsX-like permease family protein [Acidimicrobiales bacterium]